MKRRLFRKSFILVFFAMAPGLFSSACATSKPADIIDALEVKEMIDSARTDFILLDVRGDRERQSGYIPKSVHIWIRELPTRMDELDQAKEIIIYCHSGVRSAQGLKILRKGGFSKVRDYGGGWSEWKKRGFPVVRDQ